MFLERIIPRDPSVKRHFTKTITWRIIGTVDTMALGWFITGNPMTGVKIGSLEVVTKMVLYFFHERAWYKVNWGVPQRKPIEKVNNETIREKSAPLSAEL
jgi:adenylylsulfate kinase